ncbi:MAG: PEGA domain-containing protein [Polyangiaceae bacterium]|nr:PEGA domain-containing protein [Polyangiaceae bacterium]
MTLSTMTLTRCAGPCIVAIALFPCPGQAEPARANSGSVGTATASDEAPEATEAPRPTTPAPEDGQLLEEASDRYMRGLELYGQGEYLLALIEFERAYELIPNYKVLYNIGQVRIQLTRYSKAREALESYLEQGGDQISSERRQQVQADLEMLAERTARLRIVTTQPGARISMDGVAVGTSPLSEPLLVNAGEHNVEVRKSGFETWTGRVTLAGRDERRLAVTLVATPEAKPPPKIVVERRTEREIVTGGSARSLMWVSWAATGTLALGAGVVGYFGINKANDLESMRTDYGVTRQQLDDTQSSARTLFLISDLTGAAAVLMGGVSLYLTLSTSDAPAPPADRRSSTPTVGLAVDPGGVRWGGWF